MTRAVELVAAILLIAGMVAMQVFIGGTRLAFGLPIYASLGLAGLAAFFAWRQTTTSGVCLWSSAVFFGYVLARAWFSPVPYLARIDIFSVLGGLTVYLVVTLVLTSARWRMTILVALLVAALVQVGIGAVQFRAGNNFMLIPFLQRFDYGRRASGFYVCPNHLAGLLEVIGIFCVSLVCWSRWPIWAKLVVGYAGLVCYAGLALTGSRGGYLSAGASLIIVTILSLLALRKSEKKRFWRIAAGGGLFAVFLVGMVLFGFKQSEYLNSRAQNVVDPTNVRLDLWEAAIAQSKLQPVLGTGSGTYLYYGRRFRTQRMQLDPVHVHNDYLHLLAEYGAVGAVTFLLFLGAHLWRGMRTFSKLGPRRIAVSGRLPSNNLALTIGALGAVAAFGVHSLLDFNLHIPANVLLLAFVFGILATPASDREGDTVAPSFVSKRLVLAALAFVLLGLSIRYMQSEACAERARVALRDDRYLVATRWAEKAVRSDDKNPEAFFYLGESRVRRAEGLQNPTAAASFYRAAIEPFERASALAPNDETFLIALGRAYAALGRFAEAEWMFGRALAWDPRSIVAQKSYQANLDFWRNSHPEKERPVELLDKSAPSPPAAVVPSPRRF